MSEIFSSSSEQASSVERLLSALKQARARLEASEYEKTEPIAIIGMGCRFPGGAKTPQDFWELVHSGVDGIGEIPASRWDVDGYYHPDPDVPGKMYTKYGGFISEVDTFDPQFFGISPREAECMDPQQRLLLEVSWEAIENAGIAADSLLSTPTGLFVGISFDDYSKLSVNSGDATRIDAYSSLGNSRSIAVGRLGYILGIQGPAMQLDTSCSSSLLAVHLACQSLRSRECNLALAGGVNLMLSPEVTISFSKLKALAGDGRCKTFDASADGYARGEGCGIIVLKRLSDALADNDNILALIRGSAVNHDGRSNGLTAPNGSAQEAVIRAALDNARVKPEEIQYVEAHGTGTALGDPIEVLALNKVLGFGRSLDETLYIGSVKTNFGHLEAASGVAGLMKVVLSLQNKTIPPSLHFQNPNPYIPWAKIPIKVPTQPIQGFDNLKFAGVSSFGMSGTNVHVVLEAAPENIKASQDIPQQHLFTISAKSEKALRELADCYQAFLQSHNSISLADICFTAQIARSHFDYRLAIVASSTQELADALKNFLTATGGTGLFWGQVSNDKRRQLSFIYKNSGVTQPNELASDVIEINPTPQPEEWRLLLENLGKCYVEGVSIDWSSLHRERPYNKVVLPNYPFQRSRYWLENASRMQVGSNLHPLLGKRLRLPFCPQIRFESQLGINSPAHQEHHRLFGINIVAAAEYISLILSAVQEEFGTPSCTIEQLFFQKALVLSEKQTRTVQIVFNPENQTKANFEIISLEAGSENLDTSWVKHVNGSVELNFGDNSQILSHVERRNIQNRCENRFTGEEYYNLLKKAGYTLGSAFTWIGEIWQTGGEALGRMVLPELPDSVNDYQLYPGLLDSCFQVLGICRGLQEIETLAENNFIFIPFQIQRFEFFQQPTSNNLWCYAILKNKNSDEVSLTGDILIFDDLGAVIAKITNFEVRKANRAVLSKQSDLSDWFYQLSWQDSIRGALSNTITEVGRWLIFAPEGDLGEELARRLGQCILVRSGEGYEKLDEGNYRVSPTQPEDFLRLLRSISQEQPLKGIVHLWSLDALIEDLAVACELGCASALNLVKAIVSSFSAKSVPIMLVTAGVHNIDEEMNPVQLQQAPLWGLGRTIFKEHPELMSRCLDLEWGIDTQEMVRVIVGELSEADGENQIAYRNSTRKVLRLNRAKLETDGEASNRVKIESEGCYLITGGLGALGLLVAQWMAQQGAKHLVLTGRSTPSPTAQQTIKKLETAGISVSVILKDISLSEDVADILKQIEVEGRFLRGVVHAAGVIDDGLLSNMDWERFSKVMKPKVEGTWYLHKLTKDLPLDFFACFSSIASLLGSPGQGNYAAANAFLDSFAHHCRAMGLPGLSINWGPWAESGMAARMGSQHLSKQGIARITSEKGLEIFTELLSGHQAQVGVFSINWAVFQQQIPVGARIPELEAFVTVPNGGETQLVRGKILQQLESAPIELRRELLTNYVRSQVAKILNLKTPELIGLRERFFDLGIDSLMAIELKNIFESSLGCSVRSTVLFDYPTLETLVNYLIEDVLSIDFELTSTPLRNSEEELSASLSEMAQDELALLLSEKLSSLSKDNSTILS